MTAADGQPTSMNTVVDDIIGMIQAETECATALTADSGLQDAGMDSARVLSLVFRIEARYDIELDAEDSDDLRTVGDLARLVQRRIQERS
ncbi:phosphopantetheine-binding protein [Mycolicibacterium aromaticivorans JS19b1 = JCM 16368]|uniref:Phosphopantetheine-binding protein n=1 Tax=Mycolicibacterium aromaticivorans JS19b1 = JCM 16368 TaxID=1440774 RepID=A0A064CDQ5_9MYCO|nr:acyl carrier protein [Mycolicibacterium aromaticivorans]KDE98475.1 phosphopantetheine-binding protein [Mycolicibacterium aromaticivorans JS19b1 = JCM 16368]